MKCGLDVKEFSNVKEIDDELTDKYFWNQKKEHLQNNQEFMPFKRNSKVKTMNSQFLKMIFANKEFIRDYKIYLGTELLF